MTNFKAWDQYATEAEVEPFRLPVSDEETLVFECPSGTALLRVSQGMRSGDLELILRAVVGEQWERVEQLLGSAGHKAFPALVEDMMAHFDMYEDVALVSPDGGKRTARRPTEIRRLLAIGYRPVGEDRASRG